MKKILVPTDFSDNAWDALTYAVRLYDDIPCQFYILNTFEVNPIGASQTMYQFQQDKVYAILKEESENELKEIINHLKKHLLNDKHEYKTFSVLGPLVGVVKDIIIKESIDVMIMGTAGASGIKAVFMGSNTVRVLKKIDTIPIVAVPEKYLYEEPQHVVFATDFKKHLSKQDLLCLSELQLIHNFNIQFLHIKKEPELSEIQQFNIRSLKIIFDENLISFKEIESDAKKSRAILTFTEKENIDMLCLANYEQSFIEKLTHESVVKKVSFHSTVPLLILPA